MIPSGTRKSTLLCVLFSLAATVGGAFTDQRDWQIEQWVDWKARALYIQVTASLPTSGRNLPAAEHTVRRQIDDEIDRIFFHALQRLRIDSWHTLGERISEQPRISSAVQQAAGNARLLRARRTEDMRNVEVQYRLPLFPEVARSVVTHDAAEPLPRVAGWVPNRRYTGVVIFAHGELPVHGEDQRQALTPALLPDLYDTDLRRLLSYEMLSGEDARGRGLVQYVADVNDPLLYEVAGPDPLRVTATAVFGRRATDLIISRSAADQLLQDEANARLLREGRIVVVVSPRALREELPHEMPR